MGEAPGENEDKTGEPFVGRAGKMLDKILAEAGLSREEVYITNTIKCRPPNNRTPRPEEIDACALFLRVELKFLKPAVIVPLGGVATRTLTGREEPISKLRGQFLTDFIGDRAVKIFPTFHPSYLLRNSSARGIVVEDFKRIKVFATLLSR